MSEWEVSRPTGACSVTGRQFADGDVYFSALFEQGETFQRRDYAPEAWQGPPEGAYCTWKSRMPVRDKPRRLFVDDAMLQTFFERLESETDEQRIRFRFVLALILMRKRLLKYTESHRESGVEWWTLRVPGTDRVHRVRNPDIDEEQIREVSRQLGTILAEDYSRFDDDEPSGEDPDATDAADAADRSDHRAETAADLQRVQDSDD